MVNWGGTKVKQRSLTVKELIEKLQQFDENLEIQIATSDGYTHITNVEQDELWGKEYLFID